MGDSFIRTESGLRNEHLFHDVDYVVYLEGGSNSYSLAQVLEEGKFNVNTVDVAFWNHLFARYMPNYRFKYKSIGSKIVLKELSEILISRDIQTVLICMDNEFDELLNKRINFR